MRCSSWWRWYRLGRQRDEQSTDRGINGCVYFHTASSKKKGSDVYGAGRTDNDEGRAIGAPVGSERGQNWRRTKGGPSLARERPGGCISSFRRPERKHMGLRKGRRVETPRGKDEWSSQRKGGQNKVVITGRRRRGRADRDGRGRPWRRTTTTGSSDADAVAVGWAWPVL